MEEIKTPIPACDGPWPELDYNAWAPTLKTIHMWTQIIGKVRLKSMPWQNHSWHTALYFTPKGLSTGPIPYLNGMFELAFDFSGHRFSLTTSYSGDAEFDMESMSVAKFYSKVIDLLDQHDIHVRIHSSPNEVEPAIPFSENDVDKTYDRQAVSNFWQVALSTHRVFSEFRSEFIGKCSPVHFFWGAFDIAVTRFSGALAPTHQGAMPNMPKAVMQEAYSQEVSSVGFWPGSDDFPQAMFYAYGYPSPAGYDKAGIEPDAAFWSEEMGEWFLPYEVVRTSNAPEAELRAFLDSTYAALADLSDWDRERLER